MPRAKPKPKMVEVTNTHGIKSVSLGPNFPMIKAGETCEIPAALAEVLEAHPWLKQK